MNTSDELGLSVTRAFQFLTEYRNDLVLLLSSLDILMDEHEWKRVEATKPNQDSIVDADFRLFSRDAQGAATNLVIGVNTESCPPKPLTSPVALVVAASFVKPVSHRQVWDNWWTVGSHRILKAVGTTAKPVLVDPRLRHPGFIPDAERAEVFVVPICDITSVDLLRKRVVEPAIAMALSLNQR